VSPEDGWVVLGPGEGQRYSPPGHPGVVLKADAPTTQGRYSLLEFTVADDGPPLHVHHDAEEAFYVLGGQIYTRVGAETVRATTGGFVLVPRGTPHTFANSGDRPGHMLAIFSPPGFEQFFPQVAALDEPPGTPQFFAAVQRIRTSLHSDLSD
jgi:mannose-6-phosphate isomerase-like protein (cupin superfamily)